MPRVSDESWGTYAQHHHPGAWAAVVAAERSRQANSLQPYISDPRELFLLSDAEIAVLQERSKKDAEALFTQRHKERQPITVSRAVLRCLRLPNDLPMLRDRDVHKYTVHPDDTIEAADAP
ncbi:Uncharacterised protein [Mycobacteroides abscessus subsp. abscessus]|uniref:hypothetical protein n=1 Tax=Mycobacteroides abscessus TaxID=36809 RepID=UPI00092C28CC|nr:hypothetical protein [Mycobacteroides abscessus]SHS37368.1 Uncharacterised protein [Mycobacteroides abscessus subsp. abscessus]SHS52890.1 Uncharacterised protein [Mycobacteroides abscessus subsp. abscessus]SHS85227.1 Uncharacterised protein [Mycobacteroides abscessus subsp. abscessus]SHT83435.1 Uncharacterised protein [Mycobacteroides abscessus subsp. abscessus]SHX34171.1 Uncharacterised protein [Mycobacteroides abscessus subsp. abscessus]